MSDAKLILDCDFDSGSLDVKRCSVDGDTVKLAGRDNHNTGSWKWLYFCVRGASGRQLKFQIKNNFDTEPKRLDGLNIVYSYDNKSWHYFDQSKHNTWDKLYQFGNKTPFREDTVYIAYGFPYPLSRVIEHTEKIRTSPWVSPTASSDDSLVLGLSPGGTDDLGRPIASNPLFGYQITDPGSAEPKKTIVLMSGVHPNETLANHTLEGLLDYLLSDDQHASDLRKHARFLVYPMANPDGRLAGYNRSTVQHVNRDANRFWREDLWTDMPDIATVGKALLKDTNGKVDYFIDLHCWTDTQHHVGILCKEEGYWEDPFWVTMTELEPGIATWDSGWDNPSTETYAFKQLNAGFCMTFELMYLPGETIENLHRIGRHIGVALHRAINAGLTTSSTS